MMKQGVGRGAVVSLLSEGGPTVSDFKNPCPSGSMYSDNKGGQGNEGLEDTTRKWVTEEEATPTTPEKVLFNKYNLNQSEAVSRPTKSQPAFQRDPTKLRDLLNQNVS